MRFSRTTARPRPAKERLHEGQRQGRLHGRLDGVLADEVEDDLVGKAHQQLPARAEQLAHTGDLAQGQGRDLSAGRDRVGKELVAGFTPGKPAPRGDVKGDMPA